MRGLIDFHVDTASEMYEQSQPLKNNILSVDIEKLQKSNSIAQFFAMFIDMKKEDSSFDYCNIIIDNFHKELEMNKDSISLATTFSDLINNDKISAFLTIEEGDAIEGNIDNLSFFKNKGVSLMTLLWNYENDLGFPNHNLKFQNNGLKTKGIEAVKEMNNLNMLIDVSHLSDAGFNDVIAYSSSPIIASHSNSREMTNHPRNLTNEMIKVLANKGGVMGMNFCYAFMRERSILNKFKKKTNLTSIKDIVRHISHIHKVGGIDVISIGSDFDGIVNPVEISDISEMHLLSSALSKEGFSSNDIDKIFYKNGLRIIEDVLK